MENSIIIQQSAEVSPEYSEAVRVHNTIMANGEVLANSLFEVCKNLKKMRDEKLFVQLGYERFEDYCEKMAGIKSRMAYNYISTYEKLGGSVLQSNANLGITKLELIAKMNPQERVEKLEDGTLAGMSVAEIKDLVKKSKEQGEQITLLETQKAEQSKAAQSALYDLEKKYKEKIEDLEEKERSDKAQEVEDAVKKKIAEIKAEIERKIEKEKDEKATDSIREVEAALTKAKEDKTKAAKEAAEKIDDLKNKLSCAEAEKDELQKKLAVSDEASTKALIFLDALQKDCNNLLAEVGKMEGEQQQKFLRAVAKVAAKMQELTQV